MIHKEEPRSSISSYLRALLTIPIVEQRKDNLVLHSLCDEDELTLVFKKLRPTLKMLVPIWKALCAATDCKDRVMVDGEYWQTNCVDGAAVEKPITLKPGEEWTGRLELSAFPSL
ncbi:putative glucose-6-phosphate 1-epimerase isoform X1 [Tanacetum coccineum]